MKMTRINVWFLLLVSAVGLQAAAAQQASNPSSSQSAATAGQSSQPAKPSTSNGVAPSTSSQSAPQPPVASTSGVAPTGDAATTPGVAQGPSYEETMTWLKDKISKAGIGYRQTFTYYGGDQLNDIRTVTYAFNPAPKCHLVYRNAAVYQTTDQENQLENRTNTIPSGDIDIDMSKLPVNSIVVRSSILTEFGADYQPGEYDHVEGSMAADRFHESVVPRDAAYWAIDGLKAVAENGKVYSLTGSDTLVFADQGLAQRVAKALNHAIELCGGKPKAPEPF